MDFLHGRSQLYIQVDCIFKSYIGPTGLQIDRAEDWAPELRYKFKSRSSQLLQVDFASVKNHVRNFLFYLIEFLHRHSVPHFGIYIPNRWLRCYNDSKREKLALTLLLVSHGRVKSSGVSQSKMLKATPWPYIRGLNYSNQGLSII